MSASLSFHSLCILALTKALGHLVVVLLRRGVLSPDEAQEVSALLYAVDTTSPTQQPAEGTQ